QVVSEAAGTNSQSAEGEAAGPSVKVPQFKSWLYLTQHGLNGICKCEASGLSSIRLLSDAGFEPTVIMQHEAVIGGFTCLYEMAHPTNYPQLFSSALGCDYFEKLKVDQRNTQLDSHVKEHLDKEGCVFDLVTLEDGKLTAWLLPPREEGAPGRRALGRGTDGAAVMTGKCTTEEGAPGRRALGRGTDGAAVMTGKCTPEEGAPGRRALGRGTDGAAVMTGKCTTEEGAPGGWALGLGTDGAAVMTGRLNGVAKQLADWFL
ncbi:hypothetical protein KUCAC02_007057, partial [Chaenocephalus aceratus]